MKKFKKLIPALCMLLVSAVMLGTTTFAWFSMNNKVSVNGMSVEAKANTLYAIVLKENDVDTNTKKVKEASYGTYATGELNFDNTYTGSELKKYPLAYTSEAIYDDKNSESKKELVAANNFYTANSSDRNDAASVGDTNLKLTNVKVVDKPTDSEKQTKFAEYTLKYTLYVGITKDSATNYNGFLKIKSTLKGMKGGAEDNGTLLRAFVVVDGDVANGTYISTADETQIASTVSLTNEGLCAKVEIYLFIDGNSTNVKTTETATISGMADFDFILDSTKF